MTTALTGVITYDHWFIFSLKKPDESAKINLAKGVFFYYQLQQLVREKNYNF
jgi:hypothetical protein